LELSWQHGNSFLSQHIRNVAGDRTGDMYILHSLMVTAFGRILFAVLHKGVVRIRVFAYFLTGNLIRFKELFYPDNNN
jgi:hypothetical protein